MRSIHPTPIVPSGTRPPCPCHERETADEVRYWHESKGPLPLLRRRHDLGRGVYPTWADHPYRLRVDGRWCYVAEPYGLNREALDDLVWLDSQGWQVSITGWQARHNPGNTVAIHLTRKGGGS